MSPTHQVTMLKFIKNLSMLSTTLDALQNSNAIDVLTELLRTTMNEPHFKEISGQVLNTIFNLCRLNKSRQEDAALNGIIPVLQRIVKSDRPLKEFSLPILCDMAHSGKVGRRELWRNKGLPFYISLLQEPSWQVTALDAIFIWLQEETAKVEEHLLSGSLFTLAISRCFTTAKANSFENLLEPLQKLLRLSPPVALSLAHPELFTRIQHKLSSNKALVRSNLLRIVRSICDASNEQGVVTGIEIYGLYDTIQRLAESDTAILVRSMAEDLIKSCEAHDRLGKSGAGTGSRTRNPGNRRASASTTPPSLLSSQSMPPTPTSSRSSQLFFPDRDRDNSHHHHHMRGGRPSILTNGPLSCRPVSRDGSSASSLASPITPTQPHAHGHLGERPSGVQSRSRLPRTTSGRSSRQSTLGSPAVNQIRDENVVPVSQHGPTASNSRRRRQVSGGGGGGGGGGVSGVSERWT